MGPKALFAPRFNETEYKRQKERFGGDGICEEPNCHNPVAICGICRCIGECPANKCRAHYVAWQTLRATTIRPAGNGHGRGILKLDRGFSHDHTIIRCKY